MGQASTASQANGIEFTYEFADGTAYTDFDEFINEFRRRPMEGAKKAFFKMVAEDVCKIMRGESLAKT